MKRTQVQSTANPNRKAPAPAMTSMTTGFTNRSATSAPSHKPTCDAAHAQAGVISHPTTTSKCAIHLGTVRYPLRASTTSAKTTSDNTNPAPAATGMNIRPPRPSPSPAPSPPATAGRASDRTDGSPPRAARPDVTIAPIHPTNVPSIHQIGRYHHVLPPPMASQVHGYALKGRRRMISIAIKTIVPHNAIAAALATPWTERDVAKNPG